MNQKNNQVKVCILTSVHRGTDVRIFHKEAKTLVSAGYRVTIIAQHPKEEIIDRVRFIPQCRPKNRLQRMTKSVINILSLAIKENAYIYHFHDPELIFIGLFLKLIVRKKVIYDVHEDVPEQILSKDYIPLIIRKKLSGIINLFEKNCSRFFDYIICATQPIADKFLPFNRKTIVVMNYISKEYVLPYDKTTHGDKNSQFHLVFAGSIYDERGIIEAIQAMNLYSELPIKLDLFGKVEKEFLSLIKKEDIYNKVIYKGVLTYDQILKVLPKYDAGFICDHPLIRHIEGFPVKLCEYMATGIPVIASNFPVWKQIVDEGECGITVDPLSPKEIGMALKKLIDNPDLRTIMGNNGKRMIIEKYNWEMERTKLINAYNGLIKKTTWV